MPEDFTNRAQNALIDFLRLDCDLASTFLRTAAIDIVDDPQHSQVAVEKARTALDTVRRLVMRVEDPAERERIEFRADDLDATIRKFPK